MPLHDVFTPANIAGYYNASQAEVDATLGEKYFPVRKQRGLTLSFIKGAGGRPVVLRPSAFDTKVTYRDRINVELNMDKMPFFKEAMLIKEVDRMEFIEAEMMGNQTLIDTITATIFNDRLNLVNGAKARLEAMRLQLLATGMISINANGVFHEYDYQLPDANKGEAAIAWGEEGYDPIQDIEDAIEKLNEIGGRAEVLILNSKTFGLIRNAPSTTARIKLSAVPGAKATTGELEAYLKDEYGLIVQIKNETFVDDDGVVKKYYPDGRLTLAPNSAVGNTVMGTTPEELDLISGANLDVSVVETGIAITVNRTHDPVNTETKVSMISLPSFEQLDQVFILDVDPEPTDPEA